MPGCYDVFSRLGVQAAKLVFARVYGVPMRPPSAWFKIPGVKVASAESPVCVRKAMQSIISWSQWNLRLWFDATGTAAVGPLV
jgi:hypothetical protein